MKIGDQIIVTKEDRFKSEFAKKLKGKVGIVKGLVDSKGCKILVEFGVKTNIKVNEWNGFYGKQDYCIWMDPKWIRRYNFKDIIKEVRKKYANSINKS